MTIGSNAAKWLSVALFVGLAGCGGDWRADAIRDGEALVRQQFGDTTVTFTRVAVTGDRSTGQVCGHFERPDPGAGTDDARFIAFIDGGAGQNPYVDDAAAPYPRNKGDFELNWRTQCLDLGYHD